MIDEKKLIEDVKQKVSPERFGERCNALDVIYAVLQVIDEQPKTDWIPCEERLPSEEGQYLVTLRRWNCITFANFKDIKHNPHFDNSDVIAWQPLPQPYKKEGAE